MNISTGGPHILLFERDQQLAVLLTSELQLGGYECHTARTAVEVFDAIARYPVRLVLVNLAQAAAARREFWVALDTQRRGSGIQVITFHCANLAGYGPREIDEYNQGSSTPADMEIDGMLGLMNLVDAVRTRVPNAESMASTMPRMPRSGLNSSNATAPMAAQRPGQSFSQPLSMPQSAPEANTGSTYRVAQNGGASSFLRQPGQSQRTNPIPVQQPQAPAPPLPSQMPGPGVPGTAGYTSPSSLDPETTGSNSLYNEKIRAVLYPSQRGWSSGTSSSTAWQDIRTGAAQDTAMTYTSQSQGPGSPVASTPATPLAPSPSDSMLQRLARGQFDPANSGLEQLSRLAQNYPAPPPREEVNPIIYQPPVNEPMAPGGYATGYLAPAADPITSYTPPAQTIQFSEHTRPLNVVLPTSRLAPEEEPISAQPMRPAPIQDLPLERTIASEGIRRPDVLSRANYGQPTASQPAPQAPSVAQSPLASIVTAAASPTPPSAPLRVPPPPPTPTTAPAPIPSENRQQAQQQNSQEQAIEKTIPVPAEKSPTADETGRYMSGTQAAPQPENPGSEEGDESREGGEGGIPPTILDHNAVILDILQSLPPMPLSPQQQQGIQAQVLNGRATRSLGSVLLDGHLVPQDRLEVAHNIQRMLRGVDLNYQLGDILLMFKLLTPDQLLAASLVSYGLISTTQISTLGRIRQELHAIGLEYDLENLLIMFRILTPEQLREVRANVQN
jgi:hypothetical protein